MSKTTRKLFAAALVCVLVCTCMVVHSVLIVVLIKKAKKRKKNKIASVEQTDDHADK